MNDLRAMFNHLKKAELQKPAPVEHKHVFDDFTGLKKFEVDKENKDLASEDGVLYNKDKKHLIAYPADKEDEEFTVPDGVEEIAPHAFKNAKNLKKIVLPDSVKRIGRGAFEGCEELAEVKLPEGIKVIEEDTFKGAAMLEKINKPEKLEVIKPEAFEKCEKLDDEAKEIVKKHADRKYGDVTGDKKVDMTDLSVTSLAVIGDIKIEDEAVLAVADVIDDDELNIADVSQLKRSLVGLEAPLGPDAAKDLIAGEDAE